MPTNDDVGEIRIQLTATDTTYESVSQEFNINVINQNDPPIHVNEIPDQEAYEDKNYYFQLDKNTFNEIGANNFITYRAYMENGEPIPEWLSFDIVAGVFSGRPSNSDIGYAGGCIF